MRDNTRKNALIYSKGVLPVAEGVVQKISTAMDYYQHLGYDDWVECLDDQIEDMKLGDTACQIMIKMHEAIIISLKEDKGKAKMAQETLRLEVQRLEEKAKIDGFAAKGEYAAAGAAAVLATVATGGAALACGGLALLAAGAGRLIDNSRIANQANANIANENIDLVETAIGSLEDFIKGLMGLSAFFTSTSSKMQKIKIMAEKGKAPKEGFFKIMKSNAQQVELNCEKFLVVAQALKTELNSIPSDPSTDNYVDGWLKDQEKKFSLTRLTSAAFKYVKK